MNDDKFAQAGKAFQTGIARDFSARDQSIARLEDMALMMEHGAKAFYEAAGNPKPDVYVERRTEQQVNLRYGVRPVAGTNRLLNGPAAILAVMPDGATYLTVDQDWKEEKRLNGIFTPIGVPLEDWQEWLSTWLIKFFSDAEHSFRHKFA